MNHLCGEKLQLTTLENSINCQSAERIGKGKHGGRTPATKLRSRNKSLLTQSIRNIDEEMGRVPLPLSTAGRMPAWGSWWMIRESKSRCRTREWLVPHYAIAGGPQRTSQRPQGKFEVERDKTVIASAAPLAQSASSLPPVMGQKEGLPDCSLDYGKHLLSWLGDTFSQLLSAIQQKDWKILRGCSLGTRYQEHWEQREITALTLLPRDEKTESTYSLFHITAFLSNL